MRYACAREERGERGAHHRRQKLFVHRAFRIKGIDREQALTILNESAALYAVVSSAAMECAVQPAARPQSQTKTRLHPHHEAARCGCARRSNKRGVASRHCVQMSIYRALLH